MSSAKAARWLDLIAFLLRGDPRHLQADRQQTAEECAEIRTHLLEYCKQDTLGMVRVHQALARQVV